MFFFLQRLKAAVHYTVGRICEESDADVTFTKQTIAALTEATYRQIQTYAVDLELFAKYGFLSRLWLLFEFFCRFYVIFHNRYCSKWVAQMVQSGWKHCPFSFNTTWIFLWLFNFCCHNPKDWLCSNPLFHCCRHAKRSTINTEDVKLLARRAPQLVSIMAMYD